MHSQYTTTERLCKGLFGISSDEFCQDDFLLAGVPPDQRGIRRAEAAPGRKSAKGQPRRPIVSSVENFSAARAAALENPVKI